MKLSVATMARAILRFKGCGRRTVVLVWALGVVAAALISARSVFVADVSAFLPARPSPEQALLLDQISTGNAARLLLIGIEGGQAELRAQASLALATELRVSGAFDAVLNGDTEAWRSVGETLFAHRYLLSPAVNPQRFTSDGLREGINDSLALLGTPAGALVKQTLWRDPTGESMRLLEAMGGSNAPRLEGGVWVSRQAERAVLVATARVEGGDLDGQERAMALISHSFEPFKQQGLRLAISGTGSFGVSSRATIKAEVERLAIAATVLMALLLWAALGSLRGLATAMLPVATGVLAGIAAVSLGFGQVHGITLGFGTTLIGEAVDYAIYYLIQAHAGKAAFAASDRARRGESPPVFPTHGPAQRAKPESAEALARRWVTTHWPTVRLGLWTSVCGFAALLFSGFAGLAQLGAFSIAGLVAAALTTRFVFPLIAPQHAAGQGLRRGLARCAERGVAGLSQRRAAVAATACTLVAVAALVLLPSPWRGQLSSLSPISAADLQLDAALRADLGTTEPGSLVVITAGSEAEALERAEAAGVQLDRLVNQGVLLGYESPARLLPSPRQQLERRAALPDAPMLRQALLAATASGPVKAERFDAFVDDVQAARGQPALTRAALAGTPLASALDAMLLPASGTRPWRALISLHAGAQGVDGALLRQALAGVPQAQWLNIKAELDTMYQRYLREAAWQAALGALAVLTLLALHLRSAPRLARLCLPIAAALVLVVAALAAGGVAMGILHLVGLLLVVAIGSNYALFFDHLRQQGRPDPDTLASLLLANLTTVLSFGLLALSSLPALHSIGQVVAPGALLCLVLSAVFIPPVHEAR